MSVELPKRSLDDCTTLQTQLNRSDVRHYGYNPAGPGKRSIHSACGPDELECCRESTRFGLHDGGHQETVDAVALGGYGHGAAIGEVAQKAALLFGRRAMGKELEAARGGRQDRHQIGRLEGMEAGLPRGGTDGPVRRIGRRRRKC